jgi:hypothetical protein
MVVSEETVFSWVPVPKLTMIMVSSVAFSLPTNNPSVGLIGTKTTLYLYTNLQAISFPDILTNFPTNLTT